MKYNETIEGFVKRTFARLTNRNKVDTVQSVEGATNAQGSGVSQRPNGIDTIGPGPGTASGRRLVSSRTKNLLLFFSHLLFCFFLFRSLLFHLFVLPFLFPEIHDMCFKRRNESMKNQ